MSTIRRRSWQWVSKRVHTFATTQALKSVHILIYYPYVHKMFYTPAGAAIMAGDAIGAQHVLAAVAREDGVEALADGVVSGREVHALAVVAAALSSARVHF